VKLSIDNTHGTGFFVAAGLILTCHHVVKNAGDRPIKVRWQNQEDFAVAKVLQSFPDPVDLALLKFELQFETVETLACVELDGAIAAFDDLFAYGYPDIDPNGAGVVLRCDGLNGDEPPKIKFSDGRVRSGLSGAPLLNPATGKVCGVVKYTEDRSLPLGGGGIPIATVLEYFPVLNTPYKGLAYFKDDDARFFFGRTALTDLLLDRLQQSNFLALLGASGSGKSSVLRAGLLNQLRQERLSGSDRWELRVMLPTEHPLKRLANEFVDQKLGNIDRAVQLATAEKLLAEGKDGLRRLVEATAKATRMVLVIDQFEESFTLCQNLEEREQFFACLIGALGIAADRFCLAIAMRADFFGKCVEREYGGLSKRIAAHLVAVTPMNDDELREAIAKPAEIVGCEVEPILIEEIVRDVAGAPANLPLMQFALSELWQLRDGNRLTLQAYKQELGGITGALEKRANAVYAQFTDELDKRAVKHIFLSLTQLGEGTEDTRRRVVMSNLVTANLSLEAIERVVRKLADEKLVVTDDREKGKVSGDAIVDVAHEALIRGWRLLRGWLDEDRDVEAKQRKLEERAEDWQRSGQLKAYLLRDQLLKDAKSLIQSQQKSGNLTLKNFVLNFVKASEKKQNSDQLRIGSIIFVPIIGTISIVHNIQVDQAFKVLRSQNCDLESNKQTNTNGNARKALEYLWMTGNKDVVGIQICGESLPNINLSGLDLSRSNLRNANLNRAILQKTFLVGADLRYIGLVDGDLRGIYLRGANLSFARLQSAKLQNSKLISTNLTGANLTGANLTGANLTGANLQGADLTNADLTDSQGLSIEQIKTTKSICGSKISTKIIGNLEAIDKCNK
jgi:uncharacterized protein YjbI with pentapeptide repeats